MPTAFYTLSVLIPRLSEVVLRQPWTMTAKETDSQRALAEGLFTFAP